MTFDAVVEVVSAYNERVVLAAREAGAGSKGGRAAFVEPNRCMIEYA